MLNCFDHEKSMTIASRLDTTHHIVFGYSYHKIKKVMRTVQRYATFFYRQSSKIKEIRA